MLSLTQRTVAVTKAALLASAVAGTVAFGAERMSERSTPRGNPAPAGFKISGTLARPLRPGTTEVLNLKLRNPHKWALRVKVVTVAITVDKAHERAGCARITHFRQTGIPKRFFPVRIPAKSTRTLRQLGIRVAPTVTMLNLPFNQDVCKGARISFRYVGIGARDGRALAR